MTWTLRFYDETDSEVAWVTADPYEWSVDSEVEDAESLEKIIRQMDMTHERTGGDSFYSENGELHPMTSERSIPITDWEGHLADLGRMVLDLYSPVRYELNDE